MEETVAYDLPTTKWEGEGKAGPTKNKSKHSKRNAKPYARSQPKGRRESLLNTSIGFIGNIFSRILGVSSRHESEPDDEDASSPAKDADSDQDKSHKQSKQEKRETDNKENVDVNKRVSFAEDHNEKHRGHVQNGPSGDPLKAAILSKSDVSQEEFVYFTDLLAAKVKNPGPDFNHTRTQQLPYTTSPRNPVGEAAKFAQTQSDDDVFGKRARSDNIPNSPPQDGAIPAPAKRRHTEGIFPSASSYGTPVSSNYLYAAQQAPYSYTHRAQPTFATPRPVPPRGNGVVRPTPYTRSPVATEETTYNVLQTINHMATPVRTPPYAQRRESTSSIYPSPSIRNHTSPPAPLTPSSHYAPTTPTPAPRFSLSRAPPIPITPSPAKPDFAASTSLLPSQPTNYHILKMRYAYSPLTNNRTRTKRINPELPPYDEDVPNTSLPLHTNKHIRDDDATESNGNHTLPSASTGPERSRHSHRAPSYNPKRKHAEQDEEDTVQDDETLHIPPPAAKNFSFNVNFQTPASSKSSSSSSSTPSPTPSGSRPTTPPAPTPTKLGFEVVPTPLFGASSKDKKDEKTEEQGRDKKRRPSDDDEIPTAKSEKKVESKIFEAKFESKTFETKLNQPKETKEAKSDLPKMDVSKSDLFAKAKEDTTFAGFGTLPTNKIPTFGATASLPSFLGGSEATNSKFDTDALEKEINAKKKRNAADSFGGASTFTTPSGVGASFTGFGATKPAEKETDKKETKEAKDVVSEPPKFQLFGTKTDDAPPAVKSPLTFELITSSTSAATSSSSSSSAITASTAFGSLLPMSSPFTNSPSFPSATPALFSTSATFGTSATSEKTSSPPKRKADETAATKTDTQAPSLIFSNPLPTTSAAKTDATTSSTKTESPTKKSEASTAAPLPSFDFAATASTSTAFPFSITSGFGSTPTTFGSTSPSFTASTSPSFGSGTISGFGASSASTSSSSALATSSSTDAPKLGPTPNLFGTLSAAPTFSAPITSNPFAKATEENKLTSSSTESTPAPAITFTAPSSAPAASTTTTTTVIAPTPTSFPPSSSSTTTTTTTTNPAPFNLFGIPPPSTTSSIPSTIPSSTSGFVPSSILSSTITPAPAQSPLFTTFAPSSLSSSSSLTSSTPSLTSSGSTPSLFPLTPAIPAPATSPSLSSSTSSAPSFPLFNTTPAATSTPFAPSTASSLFGNATSSAPAPTFGATPAATFGGFTPTPAVAAAAPTFGAPATGSGNSDMMDSGSFGSQTAPPFGFPPAQRAAAAPPAFSSAAPATGFAFGNAAPASFPFGAGPAPAAFTPPPFNASLAPAAFNPVPSTPATFTAPSPFTSAPAPTSVSPPFGSAPPPSFGTVPPSSFGTTPAFGAAPALSSGAFAPPQIQVPASFGGAFNPQPPATFGFPAQAPAGFGGFNAEAPASFQPPSFSGSSDGSGFSAGAGFATTKEKRKVMKLKKKKL